MQCWHESKTDWGAMEWIVESNLVIGKGGVQDCRNTVPFNQPFQAPCQGYPHKSVPDICPSVPARFSEPKHCGWRKCRLDMCLKSCRALLLLPCAYAILNSSCHPAMCSHSTLNHSKAWSRQASRLSNSSFRSNARWADISCLSCFTAADRSLAQISIANSEMGAVATPEFVSSKPLKIWFAPTFQSF